MGFKAVLYAPDGDYVWDFKCDTVKEVLDEVNDMGSRWIFYPMVVAVDCDTNKIVEGFCPILDTVFDDSILGLTPKELSDLIKENSDVIRDFILAY